MTHHEIRKAFLDYFAAHNHKRVDAASLVPEGDASALFTVAGMQQFKNFYLHPDDAPAKRVVTIQPCIRTIDIDEVGDDTHNTVFEMMGNFTFGYGGELSSSPDEPYFKREAIHLAWDFLTQTLNIDPHRMKATFFGGDSKRPRDDESCQLLEELEGLSLIEPQGDDNFWGPVGEEGPCGPTIEFYVDDVEVWNNVFNEYNRDRDGNYTRLPMQGVDTGMGLERLAVMMQNVQSVWQTDLLSPFVSYVRDNAYNYHDKQGRIIADHTKAALYLLCDGVKPGNKARDYILRRVIRRAVRSAQIIGFSDFTELLTALAKEYGPYRETIQKNHTPAIELFEAERIKFLKTLQQGINQLQKLMEGHEYGEITSEVAFKLFDTFGFPIELTQEIAEEKGWTVDTSGFNDLFTKHREQSRVGMEKIFQGGLADHEPQTIQHHTAHHLLLAALRQILGEHVVQRGSNVTSERLRIDVSHPEKISDEELQMAEALVNQKIEEDLPVVNETMDRDTALASGALAEFGAKYPKEVSVYTVIDQDGSPYSREFCGGPHVMSTGELGRFEILKEEASGAGIRRLRARVVPR